MSPIGLTESTYECLDFNDSSKRFLKGGCLYLFVESILLEYVVVSKVDEINMAGYKVNFNVYLYLALIIPWAWFIPPTTVLTFRPVLL